MNVFIAPCPTQWSLIHTSARIGLGVKAAVANMHTEDRIIKVPSPLKPPPATAFQPDAVGEEVAFEVLKDLAADLHCQIRVIVDPSSNQYHCVDPTQLHAKSKPAIHPHNSGKHIWVYLDAVDGTLKVSGLGNTPGVARVVNDGAWAVGVAMTEPTSATLEQLRIGDFSVSCIVDGSAPMMSWDTDLSSASGAIPGFDIGRVRVASTTGIPEHPHFPTAVVAFKPLTLVGTGLGSVNVEPRSQAYCTHALLFKQSSQRSMPSEGLNDVPPVRKSTTSGLRLAAMAEPVLGPRLFTSSSQQLSQVFSYLDSIQAYDLKTRGPHDVQLAGDLYAGLMNRHDGGAFDVLRMYGNLSALIRTMLGWGPVTPSTQARGNEKEGAGATPFPTAVTPQDEPCVTYVMSCQHQQQQAVSLEPQCGAFIAINENLANLLPCVPVVSGAGGCATNFQGRQLADRLLQQGRTHVMYTGNATLRDACLRLVNRCMAKQQ